MTTRLPTAAEINVFDSLDERCAVKNFLGKGLAEAQALFRENFLRYGEDLMFMGPVAFRFYVAAAVRYLLSEEADGDADAVGSFRSLIELRLIHEPAEVAPVAPIVREGVLGILSRFDRYGCVGNVAGRYRDLLTRLERLPLGGPP